MKRKVKKTNSIPVFTDINTKKGIKPLLSFVERKIESINEILEDNNHSINKNLISNQPNKLLWAKSRLKLFKFADFRQTDVKKIKV